MQYLTALSVIAVPGPKKITEKRPAGIEKDSASLIKESEEDCIRSLPISTYTKGSLLLTSK
jgi:hypothetical protein